MKTFSHFVTDITESSGKNPTWTKPSVKDLKQEYHVEVTLKGLKGFKNEAEFLEAAKNGTVMTLDAATDRKIEYRSHTKSKEQLLSLIKGYRSYPEFRNEDTIENLYKRIGGGMSMTMPLVLRYSNGRMRVLAGNTRLDVAFQLKKTPKVLVLDIK